MSDEELADSLSRHCTVSAGAAVAPSLASLSPDLLVLISGLLPGAAALSLAACSSTFRDAALSEASWRERLEREMGFSPEGVALWPARAGRNPLVDAFLYLHLKHEALEGELLGAPRPVRAPGWSGCVDLRLVMELSNPFAAPTWTFFAAPGAAAPWAAGGGEMPLSAEAQVLCSSFEDGRGRSLRVLSFAAEAPPGARWLPPTAQPAGLLSHGWVWLAALEGDAHEEGYTSARGAPAVTAVPLHAAPSGRSGQLTVLSEVRLRVDGVVWAAASSAGELALEVLQATDVAAVREAAGAEPCHILQPLDDAIAASEREGVAMPSMHAQAHGAEEQAEAKDLPGVYERCPHSLPCVLFPANPPARLSFTTLRRATCVVAL